jgi:hypothetical protein
MKKKRFRLMFKFWLDVTNPIELEVSEAIEELKQQRTFAKTIRDGIRLVYTLRQGRLDVLFELFPWVKAELQPQSVAADGVGLERKIEELRSLILVHTAPIQETTKPALRSLTPLSSVVDDDDQDTIIIRKDTSTDASLNLLASMQGLLAG